MQNKTGKYFKYAIGEIVLVVIGILIALQINNWNEDRKATLQLNDYMGEMLNELAMDREFLNQRLAEVEEIVEYHEAVSDGSLAEINLEIFPLMISISVADRNFGVTYSTLKSEGLFSRIGSSALQNSITSYYESTCVRYNDWALYHQKSVTENIETKVLNELPIDREFTIDTEYMAQELEQGKYQSLVNYQLFVLETFQQMCTSALEANRELAESIQGEYAS